MFVSHINELPAIILKLYLNKRKKGIISDFNSTLFLATKNYGGRIFIGGRGHHCKFINDQTGINKK